MAKPARLPDLSPYAKPFGPEELRAAMAELGLSTTQLATLCGVSRRAVEHWLAGSRPIPKLVRRVMRAAVLGGVSVNALWCC